MLEALTLLPLAGLASYVGVDGVRRWALHHHALDIPNQRSSHSHPTPRGGGLAVVSVTTLGWVILGILCQPSTSWTALLTYAAGASLIALVSWFDDLYSLSAATRLAAHGLAAAAAILAFGYWHAIPLLPGQSVTLGCAGAVITWLWIVGLTNAYNFMDGSDGMAGSQAVIAGLGWACLGWLADFPLLTNLSLLLAVGSLGFLPHNWPPARIFMGDVGSAFLGYSFAILPLLGLRGDGPLAGLSPVLGVLLVWPFIFDTALTFLRRLCHGENVLEAHRSHLYQRLIIAGYSHRFVLLLYSSLAIVGAAAAIFWLRRPVPAFCCSVLLLPSLAWLLYRFVVAEERRAQAAEDAPQIVPFPSSSSSPSSRRRAA
jgi:UDP-N-acetylmuramyl pentapeptide phosphotransferase/UDP-N-acetylglucosamine-1-phosphate transferase